MEISCIGLGRRGYDLKMSVRMVLLRGLRCSSLQRSGADPPTGCNMHGCWQATAAVQHAWLLEQPHRLVPCMGCSEWGVAHARMSAGPPRVSMQRPGEPAPLLHSSATAPRRAYGGEVVPRELPVQPSGLGHFDQQGLSFDYPQSMTLSTKSVGTTLIVTLNNQRSLEAVIMLQRTSDPPSRLHDSMIQRGDADSSQPTVPLSSTSNIVADFNHGPPRRPLEVQQQRRRPAD